jgi:hypothetical protein
MEISPIRTDADFAAALTEKAAALAEIEHLKAFLQGPPAP